MNSLPVPVAGGVGPIERWIVVDLERIRNLPERLRRLWPAELRPPPVERSRAAASVVAGSACQRESGGTKRGPDVLTAWLSGFASELECVGARITIVVSSGVENIHLALCLGAGAGHAIMALGGEGLEEFSRHQLLRRVDPGQIGRMVEDLTELVEHDCVLTLSWASGRGAAGMEFLQRREGTWFRPVLERSGDSVTVDTDIEADEGAVRMLLAAVLTQTLRVGTRR